MHKKPAPEPVSGPPPLSTSILTKQDVARLAGVDIATVHRHTMSGRLAGERLTNRQLVYRPEAVEAYLAAELLDPDLAASFVAGELDRRRLVS